jgi:hypothetical protein
VITGVRAELNGFLGPRTLAITTQDGTEYRFYGKLETWLGDLAEALTVRGRLVQATPQGITVTPPAADF